MTSRSDEELLADHLAGVSGAFDSLVSRYAHELFGFLCRFVGNAALADDLVQEAFLQVHSAAATFDGTRSFKPWLYTIAANKARDHLRSRGRRQELSIDASSGSEDGPLPSANLEAHGPTLDEQLETRERRDTVQALIGQMPEHLRMILMLGYYQQLPYAEIAEVLDIPVGTVKSRLHAAVTHFGRLWRNHENARSAEH